MAPSVPSAPGVRMTGAPRFLIARPPLASTQSGATCMRVVGDAVTAEACVRWRRHVAGGMPTCRLNARLNAASDSYPTA